MENLLNVRSGNDHINKKLGTESAEDFTKHAEGLWKFLDDLAESDPNAYSSFVNNQVKKLKEEFVDPNIAGWEPQILLEFKTFKTFGCIANIWAARADSGFPRGSLPSILESANFSSSSSSSSSSPSSLLSTKQFKDIISISLAEYRAPIVKTEGHLTIRIFHLVCHEDTIAHVGCETNKIARASFVSAIAQFLTDKYKAMIPPSVKEDGGLFSFKVNQTLPGAVAMRQAQAKLQLNSAAAAGSRGGALVQEMLLDASKEENITKKEHSNVQSNFNSIGNNKKKALIEEILD
uniref:Uncharacterized protein n=1 Tax=Polytomella parva TaxID=51329 RepID=A0A7S0UTD4_9CHLO|mmetsp:Transcript_17234/g.31443  ORF Transcript_17234/g.31443 Transcript_17234/m.31443 type:complete len:292 (+) Transcript_17234:300-1175(+)|eukprot:CAMPEP_0175064054 /NCGR_PEP_ID=MMETSP0052_2-20121109/15109_1 /TAXON_ID=51329 ORGANISM="Polytomella parva, Strain SAG 63-3" /NCGR_SAMPLE_ID=MMETSP0052_2 /ASSEMBLY_ACC=CAM_ASM_000194 /LENGTH=291 /DNA_ID=CAMNT_0016330341 /DNA_START=299 /DNA_END=1174 /DNA_ORIENTATION=+